MNKQKIGKFSLLLIGLMLFSSILLLPPNINATETVKSSSLGSIETISSKDTYICSGYPSANYGDEIYLYVGDFGAPKYVCYSYFHFEFIDKPDNYQKAEISLYIWDIGQTTQFNIYLITENWNEYLMNWQNKPTNNIKITTLQITPGLLETYNRWSFDISNYISGKTNISICITRESGDDLIWISSREVESEYVEVRPQLIWTYEVSESDNNDDNGGDSDKKSVPDVIGGIFSIFIIIGFVILTIPFLILSFIRKTKQKQTQQQRQKIVVNMSDIQQQTTMKFCNSCGEKINQTTRFCPYCRAQQS